MNEITPGNKKEYSVKAAVKLPDNKLKGKKICFLGSSVTFGSASQGESFVDFLEKRDGIISLKEAISGTTLVEEGVDSYVSRMKKIDPNMTLDLFVCQLSTNDAALNKKLGEISEYKKLEVMDTSTITGAMEYIIAYAKNTWNTPVVFYTNPKYESEAYEVMVARLLELQQKWDIGVIDLWNDQEFNNISDEDRKLYMEDSVHPTKAGYLRWWIPYMEEFLMGFF